MLGTCLNPIYLDEKVAGEVVQKITGNLLMRCFGSCAPVLPGAMCRRIMVIGATPIAASYVGEIRGYQAVSKRHERKRDEAKAGEKPEFTERK